MFVNDKVQVCALNIYKTIEEYITCIRASFVGDSRSLRYRIREKLRDYMECVERGDVKRWDVIKGINSDDLISFNCNVISQFRSTTNGCAIHSCLHMFARMNELVERLDEGVMLNDLIRCLSDNNFNMKRYNESKVIDELKFAFDSITDDELATINSDVVDVMRMFADLLSFEVGPNIVQWYLRKKDLEYEEWHPYIDESRCGDRVIYRVMEELSDGVTDESVDDGTDKADLKQLEEDLNVTKTRTNKPKHIYKMFYNICDLPTITVNNYNCLYNILTCSSNEREKAERMKFIHSILEYKPLYVILDIGVLVSTLEAKTLILHDFGFGNVRYELAGVIEHTGYHYYFTGITNDHTKGVVYNDLADRVRVKSIDRINWDEVSIYLFKRVSN